MSLCSFWIYKDDWYAQGGEGFGFLSMAHIIWLLISLVIVAVYTIFYRRGDEKRRDYMRKCMALFLILFEIMKQCVNSFLEIPDGIYLPLEICSLAEYTILIDALWPNNKVCKQLLALAFLPAAVMALVMPPSAWEYPAISFYTSHQILLHAGIVAYCVARYGAGEIKPKYSGIWISLLIITIIIIPVYFLDVHFDQDYMFLVHHGGNSIIEMVWNITGGQRGLKYILGLEILVAMVMHFVYLVYRVLERWQRRS